MELRDEEIDKLNDHQKSGRFHPLTCDRKADECEVRSDPRDYSKDGVLVATSTNWVCPCGKYTQPYRNEVELIKKLNTNERKGIFD
jgi:hypothetical protein